MRFWPPGKSLLISIPLTFLFWNNRSISLSASDQHYLQAFIKEWKITGKKDLVHKDFNSEIGLLKDLQQHILASISHKEIAPERFGNTAWYFQNRQGFCYDRAALLEKFCLLYGFPFRHAYLYYDSSGKRPDVFSLFKPKLSSHAMVEVKTCKGWMVMDTNSDLVGLSEKGEVVNLAQLRAELLSGSLRLQDSITCGAFFYKPGKTNFAFVYGLYSRHGNFFSGTSGSHHASMGVSWFHIPDYIISGCSFKVFEHIDKKKGFPGGKPFQYVPFGQAGCCSLRLEVMAL
ncbi:MAG TPA: transglutaminase domain-containing protein [Flavisolibacter sp.]|nr:transglutaminase domain-containing protein [Flavisolibacter sp.]